MCDLRLLIIGLSFMSGWVCLLAIAIGFSSANDVLAQSGTRLDFGSGSRQMPSGGGMSPAYGGHSVYGGASKWLAASITSPIAASIAGTSSATTTIATSFVWPTIFPRSRTWEYTTPNRNGEIAKLDDAKSGIHFVDTRPDRIPSATKSQKSDDHLDLVHEMMSLHDDHAPRSRSRLCRRSH